jgi:hypothetical protein
VRWLALKIELIGDTHLAQTQFYLPDILDWQDPGAWVDQTPKNCSRQTSETEEQQIFLLFLYCYILCSDVLSLTKWITELIRGCLKAIKLDWQRILKRMKRIWRMRLLVDLLIRSNRTYQDKFYFVNFA